LNLPRFQTAVRQLIRLEEMTSAHFSPCGSTDRRLQRTKSVPYHIFPSPFFLNGSSSTNTYPGNCPQRDEEEKVVPTSSQHAFKKN